MRTRVETNVRGQRWLVVTLTALLLLAAAMTPVACGDGGDDKALIEKQLALFTNQDVAGAQEIYTEDASLYFNFSEVVGPPAYVTTGVEDISAEIADYPSDVYLYGDSVHTLDIPADKAVQYLTVAYKGAHFIYAPVRVGTQLFMQVLEVRDGKIQNQYVMAMY